jgi:hypothetical protein
MIMYFEVDNCRGNMVVCRNLPPEREILGSHGGEYEDGYLLGCCAV